MEDIYRQAHQFARNPDLSEIEVGVDGDIRWLVLEVDDRAVSGRLSPKEAGRVAEALRSCADMAGD